MCNIEVYKLSEKSVQVLHHKYVRSRRKAPPIISHFRYQPPHEKHGRKVISYKTLWCNTYPSDHSFANLFLEDPFVLDRCIIENHAAHDIAITCLYKSWTCTFYGDYCSLVGMKFDMCFSRDEDGRNSIHVATMKGRIEVLRVLLWENRYADWELTTSDESIMHFCIKTGSKRTRWWQISQHSLITRTYTYNLIK